jgi:hypothetical protein
LFSFFYFISKPRLLHQKTNNENLLGHYLAGLIEGDGTIIVPKVGRNEKGKLLFQKKTASRAPKVSTMKYNPNKLNAHWVTGFCDGESCFSIEISKSKAYKTGWKVALTFSIGLHSKELNLINKIQSFFNGAGTVYYRKNSKVVDFRIKSTKDLAQLVLPHFDKYPLLTQKKADYLLFKQAVELVLRGEHLTTEGILKIISIKASLNLGLSDVLSKAFPDIIPKDRPVVEYTGITDPHWITGFADGESCFFVEKSKSKTHTLGFQVRLKFIISQNVKDVILINGLKDYFDCGDVILDSRDMSHYVIRKISSISDVVLPFFAKYPLQSSKLADFSNFCEVANIINSKAHLTQEGLDRINRIKSGMNRGRNSD